jgi:hypothetical protein
MCRAGHTARLRGRVLQSLLLGKVHDRHDGGRPPPVTIRIGSAIVLERIAIIHVTSRQSSRCTRTQPFAQLYYANVVSTTLCRRPARRVYTALAKSITEDETGPTILLEGW